MRDLVVVGGGPVGLATALHAVRAGLDVVVVEPRSGAIDKACGEGLMPGAVAALADLGVHPRGHEIAGICYRDARRCVEAPFRHGPGLGVRRTELHERLLEQITAAGVPVLARRVRAVEQRADGVVVDGPGDGLTDGLAARYLVAADGLHSPVRGLLGLGAPARGPRRFGLRHHVRRAPWTPYVEVHWAAHAEAYVTPVADDVVGVAVLSGSPAPFDELLAGFPDLAARLDAPVLSKVRGAGPLRQRSRRRVSGRALLVGDAAGYVDALTGEGIASGLAQAEAAVAAIVTDRPGDYEAAWRRLTRRHDLLTHGLLQLTRPAPLRSLLVPTAARLPRVFGAAVDQLARPA